MSKKNTSNSFFYFLYIIIWKQIVKKIIYFITKTHEIERILKKEDTSFSKYKELSN